MRTLGVMGAAVALALGACSTEQPAHGELPGDVAEGVAFRPPPPTAPAAPPFELELLNGEVLDLAEAWQDRPIVLVFFESWCTLCEEQQAGINDVAAEYQDVVLFLGVAGQSEPADAEQYAIDNDIDYPVGIDATGFSWLQYAADEPPLVALISKDGKLLRGWPGGVDGDVLRQHIADLAVATPPR